MSMKPTLILTATITPPQGVPELVRTDPKDRLQDYLRAFEFYLKVPTDLLPRIVFAENSNSDVSPFEEMADRIGGGKEVFVTSHDGLDHPASYGRAYGEMKLLDRIISSYEPVSSLPEDALIWKGTGRHILRNIGRMIATAPSSYDLYCDLIKWPETLFDMRFFSFSIAGYRSFFFGRYPETRDGHSYPEPRPREIAESMLYRWVTESRPDLRTDLKVYPRFRVEPMIEGFRGWDNRPYARGRGFARYLVKRTARQVVPSFWM